MKKQAQTKAWIVSYLFEGKPKRNGFLSEGSARRWFDDLNREAKEDGRISEVKIEQPS